MSFIVGWEAGASAQVELFSPQPDSEGDSFRLRYSAPFRTSLRPPLEELTLGEQELDPIRDRLNGVVTKLARGDDKETGGGNEGAGDVSLDALKLVGNQLLDLVIPNHVQAELRVPGLFLEMGIDEALLEYPWELMHDGDDFLCLKHFMGRFVNVSRPGVPPRQRLDSVAPSTLSILLISVPRPQRRTDGTTYEPLHEAEAETTAIVDTLAPLGQGVAVSLLKGPKATWDETYKAIRSGTYHIVHFNGHASFNSSKPHLSSLALFDRDMTTAPIVNFFGPRPPLFFVMNACETATIQGSTPSWKDRYDIFGLARAFLETGAYLVGNRWKVGDAGAAAFAKAFYGAFVEGQPLGRAVRGGRLACRDNSEAGDLSWASYMLYGDPRIRLIRT